MDGMIYLDHAATTRPFPEAVEAMLPFYRRYYGNASSGYELGEDSKEAMEASREKIAGTLRVKPENIYFTSGGTESNNWALRKTAAAYADITDGKNMGRNMPEGCHMITSKIEHPAILRTCEDLEKQGVSVTYLDVNSQGIVDLQQLKKSVRKNTVLISVMYANNEIGTIEPIREIGQFASARGILFHTDAVQAYGHVPIYPLYQHIDFLTASGHKFNGPKGTGFLYVKNPEKFVPLITGGGQEKGLRAGTENVPGIVGLGEAARISCKNLEWSMQKISRLRDYLAQRIIKEMPNVKINGHVSRRLPGNLNISLPGIDGAAVAAILDMDGICVSSASACSTGSSKPSHVLKAIGRTDEEAYGAVRLTLGEENTKEEMDRTVDALKKALFYLKGD